MKIASVVHNEFLSILPPSRDLTEQLYGSDLVGRCQGDSCCGYFQTRSRCSLHRDDLKRSGASFVLGVGRAFHHSVILRCPRHCDLHRTPQRHALRDQPVRSCGPLEWVLRRTVWEVSGSVRGFLIWNGFSFALQWPQMFQLLSIKRGSCGTEVP